MRYTIAVGGTNSNGVVVVGGPYRGEARGRSTKWDFECPFCHEVFRSTTNYFKTLKSCYNCRGLALRSYSEDTTLDYLYHVIKGRKVSHTKGFGLTKECFRKISAMDCKYCGQPPTLTNGGKKWHPKVYVNGLDRIDSSRGYFDDNVVAACKFCNVAKLDRTEEEFYTWVSRVLEHRIKTT